MSAAKAVALAFSGILCTVLLAIPADGQDSKKNGTKAAGQQSSNPLNAPASTSRIQIVYPPADITTSGDCQSRITTVTIIATVKDLHGPIIANGVLEEKDSGGRLPAAAFQLLQRSVNATSCETGYVEVAKDIPIPESKLVTLSIKLKDEWVKPGSYTGNLWLAAAEDTSGQPLKFKVSVRSAYSWWFGLFFIAVGAGLSWFATVRVARLRQLAGNQILIARLGELLKELQTILEGVPAAGAPGPAHTLEHLGEIRKQKLRELLTDKELSVIAGITVPPVGTVSVLDEIEGMNRVVQRGFGPLLDLWRSHPADHDRVRPQFNEMDELGRAAQPLAQVDPAITRILTGAQNALGTPQAHALIAQVPADMPHEDAVVHRILFTTYLLDVVSFLTVVALGVYVLIWKNPGFGSIGDLLLAFFWGLGLKLGTDAARLGPSDVRTAYGIKIPGAP